jgi:broad specificity phosphatase PhoE
MRRNVLRLLCAVPLLMMACGEAREDEAPGTLRIYLARHGQTEWNAERRLQGNTDTELNETGRRQAAELAARLEGVSLDSIYSSALRRSRATAEIVAGSAPVESLPELNEQALGKFEGVYLDGRDPEGEAEFRRRIDLPDDTLDGGESENQHLARVRRALEQIRAAHPSGRILIVGHGGTNKMALRALLDLTVEEVQGIHQANDELYVIEFLPGVDPRVWKYIPRTALGEL